jgi:hypothetical protein
MLDEIRGTLLAVSVALAAAGCQVEQQQPAEPPDIDVDVDPGRWPEYDVDWADVDVGTEERTVTIPTIQIQEETREVNVPYIRVNPPGGGEIEERTVSLEVDVPHPGYHLQIVEVRAADDDLWVIGELREADTAAEPGRVRATDQVVIEAPEDLDVRRVVIGEPAAGTSRTDVRFIESRAALMDLIPPEARVLYNRAPSAQETGA